MTIRKRGYRGQWCSPPHFQQSTYTALFKTHGNSTRVHWRCIWNKVLYRLPYYTVSETASHCCDSCMSGCRVSCYSSWWYDYVLFSFFTVTAYTIPPRSSPHTHSLVSSGVLLKCYNLSWLDHITTKFNYKCTDLRMTFKTELIIRNKLLQDDVHSFSSLQSLVLNTTTWKMSFLCFLDR